MVTILTDFLITSDSACDLSEEYLNKHNIPIAQLSYFINDIEYGTPESPVQRPEEFYAQIRSGSLPKTSQINPNAAYDFLKEQSAKNKNILHVAFSSALSGTYNSFMIAADKLMGEDPEIRIEIADSFSGSVGQGLVIETAVRLREEDKDLNYVKKYLDDHKLKLTSLITVQDLALFYRGGRISKKEMLVGSMIGIKPLLHVTEDGTIKGFGKVRGRKKALDAVIDRAAAEIDRENFIKTFAVSHGDSLEDAIYVAEKIKSLTGVPNYFLTFVGPVLGAHSGDGVIAVFYLKK